MLDPNEIDWSRLQHAYGSARDLPGLFAMLRSSDKQVRTTALHRLFGNIWHQGTVYEATAVAVPFLVELLATPERESILSLLGEIARGKSYHEVHDPSKRAEVVREMQWVRNAHAAIRKNLAVIAELTSDTDRRIRLAAALVLACFPEEALHAVLCLVATLSAEPETDARVVIGLCLALLGDFRPEAFEGGAPGRLPLAKLSALGNKTAKGLADREAVLMLVDDIQTNCFDEESLDSL